MNFAELVPDLEAAFDEVARNALGQTEVAIGSRKTGPPPTCHGAYLSLLSPKGALGIGVAAEEAGTQRLAKALTMMDPAEPDLSFDEMADAVREIVNIVGGVFKGRVLDRLNPLQIGLPVFFRGPAQPTEHTAVTVTDVKVGDVPVSVLLVYPRGNARG